MPLPELIAIPSADWTDSGETRFVCVLPEGVDHCLLANEEAAGGVDAELRVFLDAQLDAGDVVVDMSPHTGFLVLSAATNPSGARVIAAVDNPLESTALREGSERNRVALEIETRAAVMASLLAGSLDPRSADLWRLFVRVDVATALDESFDLRWFARSPVLAALMVSVSRELEPWRWSSLCDLLEQAGLKLMSLFDSPSGPQLFPVRSTDDPTPLIALPPVEPLSGTHVPVRDGVANTSFNFIAPFCRTGYGITGANLLKAFGALNADVAYFPIGQVDTSIAVVPQLESYLRRQECFDDDAPSVRLSQQFDLAFHVGRGPRIAFPIFEIDRFTPRERHHLRHQDHLLVCSEWARRVLRENDIDVPVTVVPLGVDRSIFHEHVMPASRTKDTVFVQVGKIEPRKGQLDLLEAFEAAFTPRDPVRLRLYCHNPFLGTEDLQALLAPFRQSPMSKRIELITTPLATQHDVARAMMAADCGVFCSRAEGWNLEALEMLSLGKPVIATDYSAHTEFLTADNAYLVPVTSREVRGAGFWAGFGSSEKEALVQHLRTLHAHKQAGAITLNIAGISTAVHYSWEHSALRVIHAVDQSSIL